MLFQVLFIGHFPAVSEAFKARDKLTGKLDCQWVLAELLSCWCCYIPYIPYRPTTMGMFMKLSDTTVPSFCVGISEFMSCHAPMAKPTLR